MKAWATIVGILVAVALSDTGAAGQDQPCCMPDQWHGKYIIGADYVIGKGSVTTYEIRMDMTYDATKQRVAIFGNKTDSKGNSQQFQQLGLYGDKVEYMYNLQDKTCVSKSVDNFPARCLPGNSKLMDPSVILGMGESKLNCNLWAYKISTPDITIDAQTVVTKDNCIPIFGYEIRSKAATPGTYEVITSYYDDVQEGIDSEDVFTIPQACQQSK